MMYHYNNLTNKWEGLSPPNSFEPFVIKNKIICFFRKVFKIESN